jgi:hypothetical protein
LETFLLTLFLLLQAGARETKCQEQKLFGKSAAVAMLDRSMNPGRYADQVQWATFRKMKYNRFATGSYRRVGEEVRRDKPVTIGVLRLLVCSGVLHGSKGRGERSH